jgi:hypothetical protein
MKAPTMQNIHSKRTLCRPKFNWSGPVSIVILVVWAIAVSVPITFLAAGHSLPLPVRAVTQFATDSKSNDGHWQAVHILVADCPCSALVAKYLAGRGVHDGLVETVWLVGGTATWEVQLKKSGFTVQHHDAEEVAANLGIQGGPWLRLISPAGAVAYSGGYAPKRPQSPADVRDLALWQALANGQTVKPYPAFGCAASHWLQQTIDPLGIKYQQAK